jgi:hypothetical protein
MMLPGTPEEAEDEASAQASGGYGGISMSDPI